MPRSSSIHSSKPSYPIAQRSHHSTPPVQIVPTIPTTGQVIKQSIASGIGSGIGFSAGQRIMSSFFGPSVNVPAATNQTELEKCMEHMATTHREELPLCMNLIKQEGQFREFQSCMKITNNNTDVCKELLPTQ